MEEGLGKLLVTDFIDRKVDYVENVVSQISTEAMSFNRKTRMVLDVMKVGIDFGISKGEFISNLTRKKINDAKEKSYNKWLTELVYKINEDIEVQMNKVKYKKNKDKK